MSEFFKEPENNFSLRRMKSAIARNNVYQLGIGSDWFPLTRGRDDGDRESYSYKDKRGVSYRVYWFKNEERFGNLFVDDPNYLGIGMKEFVIPKSRQLINDL